MMTVRQTLHRVANVGAVNFALTNWLPRRTATRAMGWFSKVEQPLVARASIAVWRMFSDVDLSDARETEFRSMHACFTRALRPGARPVGGDTGTVASPSDGIIVGCGAIDGDTVVQAKGHRFSLSELTGGEAGAYRGGQYVTLRLTAGMYHRFHAPAAGTIDRVRYFPGDCWNVNPPALARVPRLYCRNERATVRLRLADGSPVLMVPVAAILVASIRLHFLDTVKLLRERTEPVADCAASVERGEEIGWFEHGSTIVLLVPPPFTIATGVEMGSVMRAGQPLFEPGAAEPAI